MPSLNVVFEVPKSRSRKTKGTSHFTRSGWRTAISSRILKPRADNLRTFASHPGCLDMAEGHALDEDGSDAEAVSAVERDEAMALR